MLNFSSIALTILKVFGLVVISGLCMLAVYSACFVLERVDASRYLYDHGITTYYGAPSDGFDPYNATSLVGNDHLAVVQWIATCVGVPDGGYLTDAEQMYLSVAGISFKNSYTPPMAGKSDVRELYSGERILATLSKNATNRRMYWSNRADKSYSEWQLATWTTIAIGMATTVFVSLSTTEFGRGDGRSQRVVRTLAIVFPALGTATAAVVGFYGAQADWSQSTRSLASLSQLHGQISIDVWKQPCIKMANDENERNLIAVLDGWTKRYLDIETLSNTGNGSGPSQTAPSQPAEAPAQAKSPPPA